MKTIIVNGRARDIPLQKISHEQLVLLVYGPVGDRPGVATITYHKGPKKKPQGSLAPDESVSLVDGIVFNVVRTDRA